MLSYFLNFIEVYSCLVEPHIMEPIGDLSVSPFFISVTCGQDIKLPNLTGQTILINCAVFNGTDPLTMEVYKDGELIAGTGFPYTIVGANRSAFGTYTFVLSTEKCGRDTAVTRILQQGQLFELTLVQVEVNCILPQRTCMSYCICETVEVFNMKYLY